MKTVLESKDINTNGYPHSSGLKEARSAIAEISSTENFQLTHEVSEQSSPGCCVP